MQVVLCWAPQQSAQLLNEKSGERRDALALGMEARSASDAD
jgi:hypothetical protein